MSRESESLRNKAEKCAEKADDLRHRAAREQLKADRYNAAADAIEGKGEDDPDRTP